MNKKVYILRWETCGLCSTFSAIGTRITRDHESMNTFIVNIIVLCIVYKNLLKIEKQVAYYAIILLQLNVTIEREHRASTINNTQYYNIIMFTYSPNKIETSVTVVVVTCSIL